MRDRLVVMYDERPSFVVFCASMVFCLMVIVGTVVGLPWYVNIWLLLAQLAVLAVNIYEDMTDDLTVSSTIVNFIR